MFSCQSQSKIDRNFNTKAINYLLIFVLKNNSAKFYPDRSQGLKQGLHKPSSGKCITSHNQNIINLQGDS